MVHNRADTRFSASQYAMKVGQEQEQASAGPGRDITFEIEQKGEQVFAQLAQQIRGYLATPRGSTEEERKRHNERLNRAVLGYREERSELLALIEERLLRERIHQLTGFKHPYPTLAEALFAEVVGLNVLEMVLQDKQGLEEIQVVGTRIFEVRNGRTAASAYRFESVQEVERIQQNLVLFNNDRINPRKRWAEAMLTDGTRVTMTGFGFTSEPTLTLRFYTVRQAELAQLCEPQCGTMDKAVMQLLLAALAARFNLVIIGPTNSGKTHLMKCLIAALPEEERIITIEGRLEMQLRRDFPGKNIIEYEVDEEERLHRPAQAFKLALRQSPQRIVHAEIRDEDANIYVRACTRGHSGSMTTVHANTLEDVPDAITDMCMLDGRVMNPDRLTKRIVQYVAQVGIEMRQVAGRRRIVRIGELIWQDGIIQVRDWVRYEQHAGGWELPHPPSSAAAAKLAVLQEGGLDGV